MRLINIARDVLNHGEGRPPQTRVKVPLDPGILYQSGTMEFIFCSSVFCLLQRMNVISDVGCEFDSLVKDFQDLFLFRLWWVGLCDKCSRVGVYLI